MTVSLEDIGRARAVLIAGTTASGKSALALRLAEEAKAHGRLAWVVNADSMQVYDALHILTARPDTAAQARVPHRLYGHVAAATRYSVGAWLRDAALVLKQADDAGATPLIVGGTGLYFKALTEGLAEIPPVPTAVLAAWRGRLADEGSAALHAVLKGRDPEGAALLKPSDGQRIVRALAVLDATERPLRDWQAREPSSPLLRPEDTVRFVVAPPRPVLHRRIDDRVDRMMTAGGPAEVEALLDRRLDPELPVMKAIGVRQVAAFLRNEATLEQAVADTKTETRRYAKRQATWLRHQMADWPCLCGAGASL